MRKLTWSASFVICFLLGSAAVCQWIGSATVGETLGWRINSNDGRTTHDYTILSVESRYYIGRFRLVSLRAYDVEAAGFFASRNPNAPRWSETMAPSFCHRLGFGVYSLEPKQADSSWDWKYQGIMIPHWFVILATLSVALVPLWRWRLLCKAKDLPPGGKPASDPGN